MVTTATLEVTCAPVRSVTMSSKDHVPSAVEPEVENVYDDETTPVISENELEPGASSYHW